MKTVKKQCEEILAIPFRGDPINEQKDRIRTLENLVLKLAQQIDNINHFGTFNR